MQVNRGPSMLEKIIHAAAAPDPGEAASWERATTTSSVILGRT
jgi:hypothetical protein